MTKKELIEIYKQWQREEVENIYVIEALAKYLGLDKS